MAIFIATNVLGTLRYYTSKERSNSHEINGTCVYHIVSSKHFAGARVLTISANQGHQAHRPVRSECLNTGAKGLHPNQYQHQDVA